MRCSIKSFYPYILEKARFGSVWCTVKMIFPTSQMPSQSKFSQINHITRTNQIMLSVKLAKVCFGTKKEPCGSLKNGTPKRIRIAAASVKGRCPRPLDDGGLRLCDINIRKTKFIVNKFLWFFLKFFKKFYYSSFLLTSVRVFSPLSAILFL